MEKKKGRHAIIWILILLVIIAAGAGAYYYFFMKDRTVENSKEKLTVYTVKSVKHTETVEVSGNIEPIESENLKFHVNGFVSKVYVKEKEYVHSGTLIAELDNTQQVYELKQVEYNIEQKKIEGAKRDIELLEIEKRLKEKALEERKLYSPISGYVSAVNIEEGDYITGGSPTAIRIINTSSLKADVEVDELDVPSVKKNQKVTFSFDALPDLKVTGVVKDIPMEGEVTSEGIAVLNTEIIIKNPPKTIHPGYSFTAEIIVKPEEKILVVNKNAVMERNGRKLVFPAPPENGALNTNKRSRPVTVKTAAYNNKEVRVISGLKEGDKVLSAAELLARFKKNSSSGVNNPLSIFGFPQRNLGGRPPRQRTR